MTSRRILIVDDAVIWSAVVTAFLRHSGYEVAVAREATAALTLAREWSPDAILLDLVMPGADGAAFLRELRNGGPPLADTPVVVVSAGVDRRAAAEVAVLGVGGHLVKAQHSLRELLDALSVAMRDRPGRAA
jgi:two-component system OmpR family response regulator